MKPHRKTLTILLLLMVVFCGAVVAFSHPAQAASGNGGYTFIEPFPNTGGSSLGNISSYLANLFSIALGLAAILAVLMIIIGGLRYTFSSVSPSEKGAARSMITNAIGGLVLILASWLILHTINPDLVNFNLNLCKVMDFAGKCAL